MRLVMRDFNTGELAYDGPMYAILLAMTGDMLGPSPCISSMCHMYMQPRFKIVSNCVTMLKVRLI